MTRKEKKLVVITATVLPLVILWASFVLNAKVNALEEQVARDAAELRVPGAVDHIPEEPVQEESIEPEPVAPKLDPYEVELIGRTIWGEAGGIKSDAEKAAVAWCILNRVDAWDITIEEAVTTPQQFQGYRSWGECPQEHLDLAADVLTRWELEKQGKENVGRVLPADYLFFLGDGKHNHFTTEFLGTDTWDWSLTDPYIL